MIPISAPPRPVLSFHSPPVFFYLSFPIYQEKKGLQDWGPAAITSLLTPLHSFQEARGHLFYSPLPGSYLSASCPMPLVWDPILMANFGLIK